MPSLLIATPGAADANSFATVEQSDTYHATRLYAAAWTSAKVGQKEAALITATRILNGLEWDGDIASDEQALRFPRTGLTDPDGRPIDDETIPTFLVEATCEFGRLLLESDRLADPDSAGIHKVKAGPVEVEFDRLDRPALLPLSVFSLIQLYCRDNTGRGMTRPLIRV